MGESESKNEFSDEEEEMIHPREYRKMSRREVSLRKSISNAIIDTRSLFALVSQAKDNGELERASELKEEIGKQKAEIEELKKELLFEVQKRTSKRSSKKSSKREN